MKVLLLLLLQCILLPPWLATSLSPDSLSLLALKSAVDVDFHYAGDWNLSDADPCNWSGVACEVIEGSPASSPSPSPEWASAATSPPRSAPPFTSAASTSAAIASPTPSPPSSSTPPPFATSSSQTTTSPAPSPPPSALSPTSKTSTFHGTPSPVSSPSPSPTAASCGGWGKEFAAEVEAIGKVRHPNMVRMRVYYWAADEKLIVSEYIPNGNLSDALHG